MKYFLEFIEMQGFIDYDSATVKLEHHIGARNDILKSGGRMDIYIEDKNGNCICIENKIYAGDQVSQLERYCNYSRKSNVFYLTLKGEEPSFESRGNLISGKDYFLISYKTNIINWLQECLKEASDLPMLRETIKQYKNLLTKMTNTADPQHEKQIIELLIKNYEEATYIVNNINKARQSICADLRLTVLEKVKENLPKNMIIEVGVPIQNKYAQLWIWFKDFPNNLCFGIESFNGDGNEGGNLYIGTFNWGGQANSYTNELNQTPQLWYNIHLIEFEGSKINLRDDFLISQLQLKTGYKEKLITEIVKQTDQYIYDHKENLLRHLHKQMISV